MIDPVFEATVESGRIKPKDPARFHSYIASLNGKKIEVIIRKGKRIRSISENKYYWGVVIPIYQEFLGFIDKTSVHESLLAEYAVANREPGKPLRIARSSAMTTIEFEAYMSWLRTWGLQQWGIYIPEPNEVAWDP